MNISTAVPWPLIPTGALVQHIDGSMWAEVVTPFDPKTYRVTLRMWSWCVGGHSPDSSWTLLVDPAQCPPMLVPTHDEAVAVLRAAGWKVVHSGC